MTLVASYSIKSWPVLMGDMMISGKVPNLTNGQQFKPFNIPTHADVNASLSSLPETMITGLVQKVWVPIPRLALAWSGTEVCARSVFRDIYDNLQQDSHISFRDVANMLDERRGEAGMDLFVTGLWLEEAIGGATPFVQFAWDADLGWNGRGPFVSEYGDCYAGGSGADTFLDLLGGSRFSVSSGTPPLEEALCSSLSHLGRLAGDQMRTGRGLGKFFGGGFEIATLLKKQLQKMGDCTYHFWTVRTAPKDQITISFHASLRVAYFEDYLVMRKLEFGGPAESAHVVDEVYVIPPVHRICSAAEKEHLIAAISPPSMNPRFSVFYVHMPEKQAPNDTFVSVHKSGIHDQPKVSIIKRDRCAELSVHSDVAQRLHRALHS